MLWYDESAAADEDAMTALEGIAEAGRGIDKLVVAPWTAEDGAPFPDGAHVALTHWYAEVEGGSVSNEQGVWQYCRAVSGEAAESFTEVYPSSSSPEPGAA